MAITENECFIQLLFRTYSSKSGKSPYSRELLSLSQGIHFFIYACTINPLQYLPLHQSQSLYACTTPPFIEEVGEPNKSMEHGLNLSGS